MKQAEAVFVTTLAVFQDQGINFDPKSDSVHDFLTKEITSEIRTRVMGLFTAGQVSLKATEANAAKLADSKKLAVYVSGLVTNWHNKDKRLNAGQPHVAKNPGTRRGSSDEMVKNMRILLTKLEASGNAEGAAKVEAAIEARLAEIKASKPAKVKASKPVDASLIPESLRQYVA